MFFGNFVKVFLAEIKALFCYGKQISMAPTRKKNYKTGLLGFGNKDRSAKQVGRGPSRAEVS